MNDIGMTLDDLLGYTSREQNPKAKYNSGWKKNITVNPTTKKREATCDVWLHTRAMFDILFQHQWPRVNEYEGKTTIRNQRYKCLESDTFLKRRHMRDRETGRLEYPPTVCPFCIMLEEVRMAIREGTIKWTDPLFEISIEGEKEILHAGGVTNLFGKPKKTDAENAELKAANISLSESWKENMNPSCKYIFSVLDNDHRENGCVVSVETESLGKAVTDAIQKEMTRFKKNPEKGSPIKNPYVIRFLYHPDEPVMTAKYDALVISDIDLDDQVKDFIYTQDPPDISNLKKNWNVHNLRDAMKEYCTTDLNWEKIFSPALARCDITGMYSPSATLPTETKVLEDAGDEIPFD